MGRVDRGELVAAHAHPVEDVCALDVREAVLLGKLARAGQQVQGRAQLSVRQAGPALGEQRTEFELAGLR